jgi:hypothetical protein
MGKSHAIALHHLAEFVFRHLVEQCGRDPTDVATTLWRDYQRGGRSDCPEFLREHVPEAQRRAARPARGDAPFPPRQARHLTVGPT